MEKLLLTTLSAFLAIAPGCGASQGSEAVTGPGGQEDATGAAVEGRPRHPAPAEALASCRQALEGVQLASAEHVNVLLIEGCRDLYAEPACGEALGASLAADPDDRARIVSLGCRDAYCPLLGEPRPALCSLDVSTASPLALAEGWQELTAAARRLDFGAAGAIPAEADPFAGLLIPVEVTPPPVATLATVVRATLRGTDSGLEVVLRLPDETETTHSLSAVPTHEELAALLATLSVSPATTELVIAAGPETSFDAIQTLLDVADEAGYESFTLQAR